MILAEIITELGLNVLTGQASLDRKITGGYTGDLISDVMANSHKGQAWITIQGHLNVVAVATLRELSAVILVNSRQPAPDTLLKAETEGLPIFQSALPAFELSGRLYILLKGR
ncbi:MAG: serine kinase [Deltaproteobacteria bacterium]|nr:serine kinase [Deltaproteobacteria bacterium]